MSVLVRRGATAAMVYLVAVQGAWADLTAQDVWSDWRAYLSGAGYDISVSESRSGDTLTLTDLTMRVQIDDMGEGETGQFAVSIPEVTLTERDDGTVSVGMSPEMPMTLSGDMDGESTEAVLNYTQTGMTMLVSGAPGDMTYAYSASKAALDLVSLTIDGAPAPEGMLDVSVTMENLANTTGMTVGEMRRIDQDMTAGALDYSVSFDDPDTDDAVQIEGRLVDLAFEGGGTMPQDMDPNDIRGMLDQGFAFDGSFRHSGGMTNIDVTEDGDRVQFTSNSQSGMFRVGMDTGNLLYDLTQTGVNTEMETADLPFPVAFSMAEAGFRVLLPVAETEEAQDFALSLTLDDFVMSDMIWMMFDAGQTLPRDPASILLDLSGKAKLLFDVFDTEAAMAMGEGDAQPAELEQLSIDRLLVSAAGAQLTGEGDFTFDNSDLQSFGGAPRPEGEMSVQLVGANALLDRLIQMGLVSQEEAMQARMMVGMFARPGEGEDTLISNVVVNEQGQVLVNGNRIK